MAPLAPRSNGAGIVGKAAGGAYPFRAAVIRFAQEIRSPPGNAGQRVIAAGAAVAAHSD
jgi:hypothetical protein